MFPRQYPLFNATFRIAFEEDQLASINARLKTLEQTVANETASLEKLQSDKDRLAEQIDELQQELDEQREEVTRLNEVLAEATKVLDGCKRTALHSSKEVDKALKEIAACVCCFLNLGRSNTHSFKER